MEKPHSSRAEKNYYSAINLAADSPERLRAIDLDRVIESLPARQRPGFATWLAKMRPDLANDIEQIIAELRA